MKWDKMRSTMYSQKTIKKRDHLEDFGVYERNLLIIYDLRLTCVIFKDSALTAQQTHFVSVLKPNSVLLRKNPCMF